MPYAEALDGEQGRHGGADAAQVRPHVPRRSPGNHLRHGAAAEAVLVPKARITVCSTTMNSAAPIIQAWLVLADGSKSGDVALSTVAPIKDVSVIVTDASADTIELELIERTGVEIIQVAI
jgi:hypothetical protein